MILFVFEPEDGLLCEIHRLSRWNKYCHVPWRHVFQNQTFVYIHRQPAILILRVHSRKIENMIKKSEVMFRDKIHAIWTFRLFITGVDCRSDRDNIVVTFRHVEEFSKLGLFFVCHFLTLVNLSNYESDKLTNFRSADRRLRVGQ